MGARHKAEDVVVVDHGVREGTRARVLESVPGVGVPQRPPWLRRRRAGHGRGRPAVCAAPLDRLTDTTAAHWAEPAAVDRPTADGRHRWEATRRGLDVVGAAVVLLLTAPLSVAIAVWIRRDSPGPALLRQQRVGLEQRPFTLYKFRSMRIGGDDAAHRALIAAELQGEDTCRGGSTKIECDPRITRPGHFLRRTSLDELPQLINVLRGDMSLVGPRPCLPWEAEMFPAEYAERFSVRPGLTGLWQVSGRSTMGTLDMLRLDVKYVRSRRLRRDLSILTATLPCLFRGDGAR